MARIFLYVCLIGLIYSCGTREDVNLTDVPELDTLSVEPVENTLFGFNLNDFDVYYDTVQSGWTLSHMLLPFGIDQFKINRTDEKARDSEIGLRYIVAGKPFTVLTHPGDSLRQAQYVIYEPDVFSYLIFDYTAEEIKVTREERDVSIDQRIVSGEIAENSNLSVELNKHFETYAMTAALADAIESVFAWSIDFFKLQVGDQFVIGYEEKSVEGVPYAVNKVTHALFNHNGKDKYAFLYVTDSVNNIKGYYDEEGRETKRPFLMSPVKFARISSGYNLNRVHPIYKQTRAHLGTDYAAPTGTPILATADGTVTKATRGGANGIYVKLRHNAVYETQYLHMSKIADGIKPGVRVSQGQVIGYVGSTGAATGPHVCYRFWKNGKQVNHRTEKFPNSEPMDKALIPAYLEYIKPLKEQLQKKQLQAES